MYTDNNTAFKLKGDFLLLKKYIPVDYCGGLVVQFPLRADGSIRGHWLAQS
jgi:hypothetical protein